MRALCRELVLLSTVFGHPAQCTKIALVKETSKETTTVCPRVPGSGVKQATTVEMRTPSLTNHRDGVGQSLHCATPMQ